VNLALVLNHQCNLRCRYCYTGRKLDRPMSLAIAYKAVDFGFARAAGRELVLSFFGGEPMLESDRMEAVAAYACGEARRRSSRVAFSISTNGTLLDERRVSFLRKFGVHVQVSVDGVAPAQDAARPFSDGAASFATVDRNLRRLQAEGLLHQIVAVMTPETSVHLPDSLRYFASLGVVEIYFSPNYLGDWPAAACDAFEVSFRRVTDAYADLFRAGEMRRVDPLYGKIVSHLVRGRQTPRRCGFGLGELAVAPSGHIYPCDRVVGEDDREELRLGHVEHGLDETRVRALQERRSAVDPECAGCELGARCSSWCGCAQLETTGQLGSVSPLFCWFERLFIAEADRLANALYAERNPTFLREFYRHVLLRSEPGPAQQIRETGKTTEDTEGTEPERE
jgi:uncharacterized protein